MHSDFKILKQQTDEIITENGHNNSDSDIQSINFNNVYLNNYNNAIDSNHIKSIQRQDLVYQVFSLCHFLN